MVDHCCPREPRTGRWTATWSPRWPTWLASATGGGGALRYILHYKLYSKVVLHYICYVTHYIPRWCSLIYYITHYIPRWCSINEEVFKLEHGSCPGTERYLEAHYKCRPDRGKYHPLNKGLSFSPLRLVSVLYFQGFHRGCYRLTKREVPGRMAECL